MIWFWVKLIGGFLVPSVVLATITKSIMDGLNKVNDYFEERETPEGRERLRQKAEDVSARGDRARIWLDFG